MERGSRYTHHESRSSRIRCALSENDRQPRRRLHPSLGYPSRLAHGEGGRRTPEERLDFLLQRAPIEAGALLQTLDRLLIKAPHEDRAHPVLHTRSLWST